MWGKTKSRPAATTQFDTLIAQSTLVRGNIEFSGGLHIDGTVFGTVKATDAKDAAVRLSDVSKIEGDVIAPHVIINGKVLGNVYASEHLELAANASITGNVYYNLIEMVMGAEVNGSLVHNKEQAEQKLGLAGVVVGTNSGSLVGDATTGDSVPKSRTSKVVAKVSEIQRELNGDELPKSGIANVNS
jgi:cytoskeletal protein CcmA (bactofilin family)